MTETPRTEDLFGIAKKMVLELEKLPLHSHGVILAFMQAAGRHREETIKAEAQAKAQKANDDAMAEAMAAHAKRAAAEQAKLAEQTAQQAGLASVRDGKEHGSLILVP